MQYRKLRTIYMAWLATLAIAVCMVLADMDNAVLAVMVSYVCLGCLAAGGALKLIDKPQTRVAGILGLLTMGVESILLVTTILSNYANRGFWIVAMFLGAVSGGCVVAGLVLKCERRSRIAGWILLGTVGLAWLYWGVSLLNPGPPDFFFVGVLVFYLGILASACLIGVEDPKAPRCWRWIGVAATVGTLGFYWFGTDTLWGRLTGSAMAVLSLPLAYTNVFLEADFKGPQRWLRVVVFAAAWTLVVCWGADHCWRSRELDWIEDDAWRFAVSDTLVAAAVATGWATAAGTLTMIVLWIGNIVFAKQA